jgi:hypothetical protein
MYFLTRSRGIEGSDNLIFYLELYLQIYCVFLMQITNNETLTKRWLALHVSDSVGREKGRPSLVGTLRQGMEAVFMFIRRGHNNTRRNLLIRENLPPVFLLRVILMQQYE